MKDKFVKIKNSISKLIENLEEEGMYSVSEYLEEAHQRVDDALAEYLDA